VTGTDHSAILKQSIPHASPLWVVMW